MCLRQKYKAKIISQFTLIAADFYFSLEEKNYANFSPHKIFGIMRTQLLRAPLKPLDTIVKGYCKVALPFSTIVKYCKVLKGMGREHIIGP